MASGSWRVQIRRKGRTAAETFRRRKDGEEWALEIERNIDRGKSTRPRTRLHLRTFGDLIELHEEDMKEIGRPPRRSKAAVLASLKTELGSVKLPALDRGRLIEFGRKRAKEGTGPATLAIDLSFIRTVLSHAAAVHDVEASPEEVRLARTYVFASHDLALVRQLAHTVPVMHRGRIVEHGTVTDIFDHPQHAYTASLLASIPSGIPVSARIQPPRFRSIIKEAETA